MDTSRGIWTSTADLDLLRRLVRAGFDWLAVDAQHGPVDRGSLHGVGRALADSPVPWLVRVPAVDDGWIGAALDAGAAGVIVPSIATVQDAERACLAARYPPLGHRSWGPFGPLWGGSATAPAEANEAVRCWMMVETAGALAQVEAIAALPGVDGLFVGPFDLSLSLGTTPDALLADTDSGAPLARIVAAATGAGIGIGGFGGSLENVRRLATHGVRFLAVASDAAVVEAGVRSVLAELEG